MNPYSYGLPSEADEDLQLELDDECDAECDRLLYDHALSGRAVLPERTQGETEA